MWFVLGLVSLAVFFGYRMFRKFYWAWGWTGVGGDQQINGQPYKTRFGSYKGTYWFRFAVVCPPGFNFRIKRETRWDRFAKYIGLSVEQQLDDPAFDEHLYLVSDDPVLAMELAQIAELRQAIKALFLDPNILIIVCEGRHLVAVLKVKAPTLPLEYNTGERVHMIVSALQEFSRALTWIAEIHGAQRRDSYALRAALMVSLASALLILGGVEMFRLVYVERGVVILDAFGLFKFSSVAAAAILFLFLGSVAAVLRGSSHAHIVMWEVLISGGFGLLMSAYAIARDINCEWDGGAAKPLVVEVTHKHQEHRRKSGTHYKIYLKSLDSGARLPDQLEVKYGDKDGYMGFRWIAAITRP